MSTMKQIAQLAGVSRGTVDRVLNNRGSVNEETARKIRQIAESVQYAPSKAARSLSARKKNIKIFYIMWDPSEVEFFRQLEDGAREKAAELQEYGVTVEFLYYHFGNLEEQNAILDQAVQNGASGIVIVGLNLKATATKLLEISASGIPIVTANTEISKSGRIAFVGCNSFKSGEVAAAMARMVTMGKAKVGIIIGSHDVQCHTERVRGFQSNIENHAPGIEIVKVVENSDDQFESFAATKTLLQEHPEIDLLYLTGAGVYGACRAVESMNLQNSLRIIYNDCTPKNRLMLEKGVITAAICQQPEVQGSKPLEILFNAIALNIPPDAECYFTKIEVLIKECLY